MDIQTTVSQYTAYTAPYRSRPEIRVAKNFDSEISPGDVQLLSLLDAGNIDGVVTYLNKHASNGLFLWGHVTADHIEKLITALKSPQLKIAEVAVFDTPVGSANILRIVDAFVGNKSLQIKAISFENCGLDSKGAKEVVQRLKFYGPITSFSLANCQVRPDCVQDIVDLVNHHDLQYLSLAGNHLGPVAQMPIRMCVAQKSGIAANYSEKKLAHRYDVSSLEQLHKDIQKEVKKFNISTFLHYDGLPMNDDDEIVDVALFCVDHEPDALSWLYELIELSNKTVLKPSKEFLAANAERFDKWQEKSANCLFFAHFNKDATPGSNGKDNGTTLLTWPAFVDEKNPALGYRLHFNACKFAGVVEDQKTNQQTSGDIFIFMLAAFPERSFENPDALAADTELLLKSCSNADKAAIFEIWKATHYEWIHSVSQNKVLQQATKIYDFPLDVQGKILANIVDAYPITQAAALFGGLAALMETVQRGREAATQRNQLRIPPAANTAHSQVNEETADLDEELVDTVLPETGATSDESQSTRKRKHSGNDEVIASDPDTDAIVKRSKVEPPVKEPLLAPQ